MEGRKKYASNRGSDAYGYATRSIAKEVEEKPSVTNFIQPYLHQFFNNSHSLNGYGKPLKRPFD